MIRMDSKLYRKNKVKCIKAVIDEIRNGIIPIVKFGERYSY